MTVLSVHDQTLICLAICIFEKISFDSLSWIHRLNRWSTLVRWIYIQKNKYIHFIHKPLVNRIESDTMQLNKRFSIKWFSLKGSYDLKEGNKIKNKYISIKYNVAIHGACIHRNDIQIFNVFDDQRIIILNNIFIFFVCLEYKKPSITKMVSYLTKLISFNHHWPLFNIAWTLNKEIRLWN